MDPANGNANGNSPNTFRVLVTGANSGLGFALCCRLMDEFLYTRPQTQTLHLLFSTRSSKKSTETSQRLKSHLQNTLREANGKTLGISIILESRIRIEGVQVDLLKLGSVKILAEELLSRGEKFDAVVWNAGVAGWKGINWFGAIWSVLTQLGQAVTFPDYMVCDVGKRAGRQVQKQKEAEGLDAGGEEEEEEPVLGEVFTANVFGHYMLTHWISPLLDRSSRVVWISSTGAVHDAFQVEDIQGLKSLVAYESSKRLTEFLALTAELPSTRPYTKNFFSGTSQGAENRQPRMLVTHPGVVATSISGLHWFLSIFMTLAFYLARILGSPWHAIGPYKGAVSMVFAVLSPQIIELEEREGKGKWGSAANNRGEERVARTEVEGWGYCGKPGVVPPGSATTGLYAKRRETTKESREEFEEIGRQVWKEMEAMRVDWERRLGPLDVKRAS
ncbi:3-keto-steroid reductase [Cercospora beticola]|uniref:3-keto-steroid reductase n=1 Tax=Cercospora beticola TaxID=122368 RepID=A0A2G5HNL5_CERBT|nr:3-keto-steroid reductase [Cercospora beticola]PIA94134.1 3-keto-steroid reductase [Cercospora beticola]WPB05399.1 hypothetical protein RHO25_010051 [Cercospora beticola]